ncbi:TauD/TfdA family dioxygenase [Kitasatospora sp. NPDC002227]|uniref:TauD/TfdA family dioxygenase n=1 Tax=Kitasatospora sp. NPDC002227 TaxID=3154773 RepID=UPI00332683CF
MSASLQHRFGDRHPDSLAQITERIRRDGLVLLDGLAARAAVLTTARSLMTLTHHPDSDPDGLTVIRDTGRHTDRPGFAGLGSGEVLPHTERSAAAMPPRLMLLACSRPADAGGVSTLVDGAAVLADLATEHPDAFTALSAPRSAFFGGANGCLSSIFSPVAPGRMQLRLRLDTLARFSPDAGAHLPVLRAAIDRHRQSFRLGTGQAFLLDNHRWLHARSAFTGSRRLYRALGEPLTSWVWPPGFPHPDTSRDQSHPDENGELTLRGLHDRTSAGPT